jgi:hypothetical protein
MKFSELPLSPTPRQLRQFAGAWIVFSLVLAWRAFHRQHSAAGEIFSAMALIGLAGCVKPNLVRWLFIGAIIVTFPLGWLMTQLMLGIMFYLVLTPLALFFRIKGRDVLQLKPKPDQSTWWVERGEPPPPEKYLNQF